jgi:flavin reductase (DIM6/NTAB) family NADH-FMN oxidoreductase RutF
MLKEYIKISNDKAYKLLNTGALLLISSVSIEGKFDISPIAWQCPVDYDRVTKLLFVCDKNHKTFKNISETEQFAVSIPHIDQLKLLKDLGSCSGHDIDKIQQFKIQVIETEKINCCVPVNCIAYLECKTSKIIDESNVAIIFGNVIHAKVDKEAFNRRLLSETESGKTIHHLGGKIFITTSDHLLR